MKTIPPRPPTPPTTPPPTKRMSRIQNKRFKKILPFLVIFTLFILSGRLYVSDAVIQANLENVAILQHKQSTFNPKNIAFYLLQHINNYDTGIYFHWDDWVDLNPAKAILDKYRRDKPLGQCDKTLNQFANVDAYWLESYDKKVLRAMSNLYCVKDIPERVFFSTDESMIEVPIIGKKRLGVNFNTTQDTATKTQHLLDLINQTNSNSNHTFTTHKFKPFTQIQDIDPNDFTFNPDLEISKLTEKLANGTISSGEHRHLEFLKYSNKVADKSPQFFKYPWITSDIVKGRSHHLSFPFFKRFIGDRERQSILQHMIRSWFQFSQVHGFNTWINYGNLLGWSYNGVNMPWDTDIDVQIPLAQLDRLAREFNQSIIIENPRDGNARYLLEVAPTYVRQGNGKNFIDARYIDINSGLYIDISALSRTGFKPPSHFNDKESHTLVHCKHFNWHSLDELLPLRHTYFEGASVYVPSNIRQILSYKYGTGFINQTKFHNHNYQKDIQMWVPDYVCKNPPKNRFDKDGRLTEKGACNQVVLQDEYDITKEYTQRHRELNQALSDPYSSYNDSPMGDLPIFRKDAWDYYNDLNLNLVDNDRWYIKSESIKFSSTGENNFNSGDDMQHESEFLIQEEAWINLV
ncbi:Protein MNN4 [Spathaspora sp. JA1]|nr:Protein MNN4 [Spathaspora sp. JA1]